MTALNPIPVWSPLAYIEISNNPNQTEILTFPSPSVISRKRSSDKTPYLFSASLVGTVKTPGEDIDALEQIRDLLLSHRVLDNSLQHGPEPKQPCLRKHKTSYAPHIELHIPLETPELASSAYGLHLFRCDPSHSSCWFQSNRDCKATGNCSRETRTECLLLLDL